MLRRIFFFTIIYFLLGGLYAQSLRVSFENLLKAPDAAHRMEASDFFALQLEKSLAEDPDFTSSFDDIPHLSVLCAKDKSFRIFTWGILKDNGTFLHKGMIQSRIKNKSPVFQLHDISTLDSFADQRIASTKDWWGALYNRLIENTYNHRTYYTLLGMNGSDPILARKVIEPIRIKSNGDIEFGASVFKQGKQSQKRMIFSYAKGKDMTLRYDHQAYTEKIPATKKGVKPLLEEIKADLIIFDRLIPPLPHLENEFLFYIPAGNLYDGLLFENGKWLLKRDLEVKNPSPKPRRK